MSDEIPVTFELNGNEHKGILSQVAGSGSTASYHLTVDRYYWGQLSYIEGNPGFEGGLHAVEAGWRFNSNNHPELAQQAEFFGSVVTSWLDSRS